MKKRQVLKDMRDCSRDDLSVQLDSTRRELMGFRFRQASGQLTSSAAIGATRRKIAQILTVLQEKRS